MRRRRAQRATARRAQAAGPPILPASNGSREFGVAFGLVWHTILGADLRGQALRRARAERATHWVHAGGRVESVGTLRLPRRAGSGWARRELHAAAQLFASAAGPGAHAGVWQLDTGVCWVALARDGRVLGGGDQLLDAGQVGAVLEGAAERFGQALALHGMAAQWSLSGESVAATPVAPDLAALAAHAGPDSLLQTRRLSGGGRAVACGAALAAALAALVWWPPAFWSTMRPAPEPAPDSRDTLYIQEPWHLAFERFVDGLRLAGAPALQALWDEVLELPVLPAGWVLERVDCRWAGHAWRCGARFRRLRPDALAEDLQAGVPSAWRLAWPGLDAAQASREVPAPASRLVPGALVRQRAGFFEDADVVQAWRAAFARLEVGDPVAVEPPAPRAVDGTLLPRPADLPRLVARDVRLRGPLRSIALLDTLPAGRGGWQSLVITIDPAAQPALAESALMADIQGVIYESQS